MAAENDAPRGTPWFTVGIVLVAAGTLLNATGGSALSFALLLVGAGIAVEGQVMG